LAHDGLADVQQYKMFCRKGNAWFARTRFC